MIPEAERLALVVLRLLPGVGDRRLGRLLRIAGSARRALTLPSRELTEIAGRPAVDARKDPALKRQAQQILGECDALEIEILPIGSPAYPARLLILEDPPPVLFLRGDHSLLDQRCIAIVGSRRATAVGRRTAARVSRELSELGVAVVSGLALGIDGAAHRGALAAGGPTIAVLGCGPDRAYPAGNRDLFEAIVRRGLVVSEFPPGDPPRPHHFPRRNRIVASLSQGVVVVEAASRSGALITVDHALDLGLEVFAVPGSVEVPQAEGTNALIRDGAHLLTSGTEILEVLGWKPAAGEAQNSDSPVPGQPAPDSDATRVKAAFGPGPLALDDLVPELGLPVERVLAALTRLELNGSIGRTGGGWSLTCARR